MKINDRVKNIIVSVILLLMFMIFNKINGFENTIFLISSFVLVELWLLNAK